MSEYCKAWYDVPAEQIVMTDEALNNQDSKSDMTADELTDILNNSNPDNDWLN